MTRTWVRSPATARRDLCQHAWQAVGLVEGRDADEDAAQRGAGMGGLDLGDRQGSDEPADPLVRPIRPGQRVEQEQVRDRDRDDEDRDQPPERLARQAEDVLDRPNEVRDDRDGGQAEPDQQQRRRPARGCPSLADAAARSPPDQDRRRRPLRRCAAG